jgi:hypothetical protein
MIQQSLEFSKWLLWTIMKSHLVHQHIGFLLHNEFLDMGESSAVVILDWDVEMYGKHS